MDKKNPNQQKNPHKKVKIESDHVNGNIIQEDAQGYDNTSRARIQQKFQSVDSNLLQSDNEFINNGTQRKIQKQLEFYFGDANLHNDKFLRELVGQNQKGYVELETFLKFNKIKSLLTAKTQQEDKLELLIDAIKESQILKLNKPQTMVRRRVPYQVEETKELQQEIDKKTVYIEDIPEDSTHESLAEIFQNAGKILHVSIPKFSENKSVKGFAFIQFSTSEEAERAIAKFNNFIPSSIIDSHKANPLKVISKQDWFAMRSEFKELKKQLLQQLNGNNNGIKQENQFGNGNKQREDIQKGCLVRLWNIPIDGVDKACINIMVSNFKKPRYVDYRRGSDFAIVRFQDKETADAFFGKYEKENQLKLKQNKITLDRISGQEEVEYLDKIKQNQTRLGSYIKKKSHKNKQTHQEEMKPEK